MTNLTETEKRITDAEILEMAKAIKEEQKAIANGLEEVRSEKAQILMGSLMDLNPETSEAIKKDLLKIAKSKDFITYFYHTIGGIENICKYDGVSLTRHKGDGSLSVKSLPYRIFVQRFNCTIENIDLLGKGVISYVREMSPMEAYTIAETTFLAKVKTSNNFDTNLTSIGVKRLEIVAISTKNKSLPKPYAKAKTAK